MKKSYKINPTNKVAIFAGATALMALTPQVHAQSSVDALINRLEQKGILTVDEAKDLKVENAMDSTNDFNAALNSKFTVSDWVTNYKLSGDFRGRFDEQATDNTTFNDRIRLRYRLRVGLTVSMKDNLQVGFRLGSGEAGGVGSQSSAGNPLSNNSTMQDNGTKKFIYVDAAYGKWTAINDGTLMTAFTIGKMDNPFTYTPMVFDADYTPEGGALQATYKLNNFNTFALNAAAFMLDEESTSSHDPYMYGAQLTWNANWTPKLATSIGAGALNIVDRSMLTTANVPDINTGNFRVGGTLRYNYNPIIADASVTYTLDSFPLYNGAFPIRLAGEAMKNPGAPSTQNKGLWAGVTFGKAARKGTWDLTYRYEYLQADAWYEEVVDDDNIAFYGAAFHGGATGMKGGTDVKGHMVKLNYAIFDALVFSMTGYVNSLIQNPSATSSEGVHFMADLMWKF